RSWSSSATTCRSSAVPWCAGTRAGSPSRPPAACSPTPVEVDDPAGTPGIGRSDDGACFLSTSSCDETVDVVEDTECRGRLVVPGDDIVVHRWVGASYHGLGRFPGRHDLPSMRTEREKMLA